MSEVIASRVGKIIGLVKAMVKLNNIEMETLLCESDDYNLRDEGVMVFEDLYSSRIRTKGNISPLEFSREIGIQGEVYRMFVLDYLINNIDRHGRNIEILVDMGLKEYDAWQMFKRQKGRIMTGTSQGSGG